MRSRLSLCKDMGNKELACPRRRHAIPRIGSGDIETCRPVRKLASYTSLPAEGEPGREILEILLDKACLEDVCSPSSLSPFLYGSPLIRASNPLTHDVHFTQTRAIPPPLFLPQNFSCRSGSNSPYKKLSSCTHMGRNPLCTLRALHLQPLMLGEYPPLPKIVFKCMAFKTPYICHTFGFPSSRNHCSHIKGTLITAFVDTSKLFVFTSRWCFPKRLSNFPLLVNGIPFLHSRSHDKLNHTDKTDCVCSQLFGLLVVSKR